MSSAIESVQVASFQVTMLQDPSLAAPTGTKPKPSPKEIISGLAPHVFEEHGMKLKRSRSTPKPPPNPLHSITARELGTKASPLRVSAVISWEREGEASRMIFPDQPDHHAPIVSDQIFFMHPHATSSEPEETAPKFELSEKVGKAPLRSMLRKFQALRGFAVKLR